jgi:hypothetical protein
MKKMTFKRESIGQMIIRCRYERNIDDQISLLIKINSKLPRTRRLRFPSLMTNDYVSKALDIIEERLFGQTVYS